MLCNKLKQNSSYSFIFRPLFVTNTLSKQMRSIILTLVMEVLDCFLSDSINPNKSNRVNLDLHQRKELSVITL